MRRICNIPGKFKFVTFVEERKKIGRLIHLANNMLLFPAHYYSWTNVLFVQKKAPSRLIICRLGASVIFSPGIYECQRQQLSR